MASRTLEAVTFEPPTDWIDASVISFVTPNNDNFQANIVVTQHHIGNLPLIEYAQHKSKEFSSEVEDYDLLQGREHKLDGQQAYTLEHSFLADDPVRIQQLILFIRKEESTYTLACTHAESEFDAIRDVFEETISSFRIK